MNLDELMNIGSTLATENYYQAPREDVLLYKFTAAFVTHRVMTRYTHALARPVIVVTPVLRRSRYGLDDISTVFVDGE